MFGFFTFSSEDITAVIGWAGTLVGDLMPLLIVIIGIAIGGFIIKVIIGYFQR